MCAARWFVRPLTPALSRRERGRSVRRYGVSLSPDSTATRGGSLFSSSFGYRVRGHRISMRCSNTVSGPLSTAWQCGARACGVRASAIAHLRASARGEGASLRARCRSHLRPPDSAATRGGSLMRIRLSLRPLSPRPLAPWPSALPHVRAKLCRGDKLSAPWRKNPQNP